MCKGSAERQQPRPIDPPALAGWFHPAAVDDVMQWSARHATELQEQAVLPISKQELRLCAPTPRTPFSVLQPRLLQVPEQPLVRYCQQRQASRRGV
jgi:hypothetical protein